MNDKTKLRLPEGVRDYLPEDFVLKTDMERRIAAVFRNYGYLPVSAPMFEYVEVFENAGIGGVTGGKLYMFLDRDGSILALRPDMTPSIARIATSHGAGRLPMRFYYFENVFRYNESYQGKLKEFTQAGIELIGVNSPDADAETIAVAANGLMLAGLADIRIDIGNVTFLDGLIEEAGLDAESATQLRQAVLDKEFTAVGDILGGKSNIPEGVKTLLTGLQLFTGGADVLEKARALTKNKKAVTALDELKKTYDILRGYGADKYVMFDLSMAGQMDYYTGLIFRGYAEGSGASVLDGGRYDGLLARYGRDLPAVGFAVKCGLVAEAVRANGGGAVVKVPDTLVAYTDEGRNAAHAASDELRSGGLIIENSLLGPDELCNATYARDKGIGGMIYFVDENNIRMYDFINGKVSEVNLDELLKKGGNADG